MDESLFPRGKLVLQLLHTATLPPCALQRCHPPNTQLQIDNELLGPSNVILCTTTAPLFFVLLAVLLQFSNIVTFTVLRIFRLDNGDFCVDKRCSIERRHCMIGLQFTDEEEVSPRCMALPPKVYSIEVTENVLFEPTPERVHLCSRGGDNNTMPLYFWDTVTPFGGFNTKYLHDEYPGKLFRVLTEREELFLVHVPGRDRKLGTATTTTTTTTFPHTTTTTTIAPTTTATSSSVLTSITNLTTSSNRSSITPTTTTTTTTVLFTTPVDVRATVWTLETIPPLVGLSFCVLVLLVLYVRRVCPTGCCTCICRWLKQRRRRINQKNDNIELTSLGRTTTSDTDTNTSSLSFVNVSLEED